MDRNAFLLWLLNKFGCFNDNNVEIWRKDYEQVLTEPNIDYNGLYYRIITQWDNTFTAPSTKWLNDAKKDFIPKDTTCETVKEIRAMREQSANMSDSEIARIDEIRARMRKTLGKVKG